MNASPVEVVREFFANTTNPQVIEQLVARDATYVSLNFDHPELKRVLPWAGTSYGPQAFIDTYAGVNKFWENQEFEITDIFGEGEKVAAFGTFTHRSRAVGKVVTSPFGIFAKVTGGQITYFRFLEDTFAAVRSFRTGGTYTVHSDPDDEPFEI